MLLSIWIFLHITFLFRSKSRSFAPTTLYSSLPKPYIPLSIQKTQTLIRLKCFKMYSPLYPGKLPLLPIYSPLDPSFNIKYLSNWIFYRLYSPLCPDHLSPPPLYSPLNPNKIISLFSSEYFLLILLPILVWTICPHYLCTSLSIQIQNSNQYMIQILLNCVVISYRKK